jgi:hypothetical protein
MAMQDVDKDGKVDRVVVEFGEDLAAYSAGTGPWTLTNVPSGGSLSSVNVSGSTATLNISEGSGAKDTAVGAFRVALASNANGIRDDAGNRTSFSATAPSDAAAPVPVTFRLNNKSGGTNGRVEQGDYVTITYSEVMSVSSLCTNWSNDSVDHSTSVTATMTNSGSSDYLRLGNNCANVGTMDTNASYLTTTRTFSNTSVAWDVSAQTLTVTLGSPSGSVSSNVSSTTPTYTPTTSLEDPYGNAMSATGFNGTSSRF